jgi:chemotaxis protein methyltransferase CheR
MEREFTLTEKDFRFIRNLVAEKTGISLSDAKSHMVYSRLSRRLRSLNIPTFAQYCEYLAKGDPDELTHFVNAITTNLTAFFRENHHFEYLAGKVLPELFANKTNKRVRIWSAGCSTGEEPYSIAMVLRETMPRNPTWDIKVLATDLDSNVVAKAATGVYPQSALNGINKTRLLKYFARSGKSTPLTVKPEVRDLITFKQLNLMHEWPMKGPFDAIFCRNVVIYFNLKTQRRLFRRYAEILTDNGTLFIGHSETLFKVSSDFGLIGNTIYRKK